MRHQWFVFCQGDLLLEHHPDGTTDVPYQEEPPTEVKSWTTVHDLTMPDGEVVKTYSIDSPVTGHPLYEMIGLRQSFHLLPAEQYVRAGKCSEILYWDSTTRFCGVCGGPMKLHTEISKRCTFCGKEVWPQVAPAIIVRITRGDDEVLMARARNFRGDFYGLIAGFVETGETLEEAVVREVHEETGLEVTNIRYFASQPWPYPSGLMVGFTADYAGGQIHVQREELMNVAWFHRDHLPKLPEKLSIARRLIDDWLGE